jgi:hypothetical protein
MTHHILPFVLWRCSTVAALRLRLRLLLLLLLLLRLCCLLRQLLADLQAHYMTCTTRGTTCHVSGLKCNQPWLLLAADDEGYIIWKAGGMVTVTAQ